MGKTNWYKDQILESEGCLRGPKTRKILKFMKKHFRDEKYRTLDNHENKRQKKEQIPAGYPPEQIDESF